ncbi:MAG: hypothetical protein H6733_14680 [Alphaproteobacteria bacterium]|nr:hypothetical protein [Alphaproteobacteria bacterium]
MRGIGDLIGVLRLMLPPWALGLLAVVVALWLVPRLRYRTRARQIRGAIRRMVRADVPTRAGLFAWTFELAADDVFLLVDVANEARKRGMNDLWDHALARLDDLATGRGEAERLRRSVERVSAEPMHPVEAALRIEALVDTGAYEAARERLGEALARHPSDPGLQALHARIAQATQAATTPTATPSSTLDADVHER